MNSITEFSFDHPTSLREDWPLKLPVLRNGLSTTLLLPGRTLRYQFRNENELLFITDWENPYEECTEFTLCDANLVCRGRCSIGGCYSSYDLKRVKWIDERQMLADFEENGSFRLMIRSWGVPYLFPRLKLCRCKSASPPHCAY